MQSLQRSSVHTKTQPTKCELNDSDKLDTELQTSDAPFCPMLWHRNRIRLQHRVPNLFAYNEKIKIKSNL